MRKFAEFFGREVVLNSNTLEDSIDQYDSMLKEKALADPNRRDPRYLNVFPSSEMADWKRQWPVVPTFWLRRDQLRHDRAPVWQRPAGIAADQRDANRHAGRGSVATLDGWTVARG